MDPSVGLGQERPRQAVGKHTDAREEGEDDEDAADDQRVNAQALGDPAGDTADPAVLASRDSVAADPSEEVSLLTGHSRVGVAAGALA
jgi:hypothetical protein